MRVHAEVRWIKRLVGLVAGTGAAIVLMMASDAIAHQLFPPPAGPDVYAATDPSGPSTATLLALILGWLAAALVGGWLAIRFSRERWTAWGVAAIIILAAAYLFATVAHPWWTMVAGVSAPLAGAALARRLAPARD